MLLRRSASAVSLPAQRPTPGTPAGDATVGGASIRRDRLLNPLQTGNASKRAAGFLPGMIQGSALGPEAGGGAVHGDHGVLRSGRARAAVVTPVDVARVR